MYKIVIDISDRDVNHDTDERGYRDLGSVIKLFIVKDFTKMVI